MKEPKAQCMAALSRFASSRTIAGALPPNSRRIGFIYLPAVAAIMEPTLVLPVKLTFRTAGWAMRVVVTSTASVGRWYSTLRHPAGRPAALKMSPMAQKHLGDSSEPLRIVVLPAPKGMATARMPRIYGAFLKGRYQLATGAGEL